MFSYKNWRGLNRPILRPLWLMTTAAADVISVPSVYALISNIQWLFRTVNLNFRVANTSVLHLSAPSIGLSIRRPRPLFLSSLAKIVHDSLYIQTVYISFFSSTVLLHRKVFNSEPEYFGQHWCWLPPRKNAPHSCLRQDYTGFQHTSVFSLHRVYFCPLDTVEGP